MCTYIHRERETLGYHVYISSTLPNNAPSFFKSVTAFILQPAVNNTPITLHFIVLLNNFYQVGFFFLPLKDHSMTKRK